MIRKFFKIELIEDNFESPSDYDILHDFTEDEKYLMMSEGRPVRMQWIVLLPK